MATNGGLENIYSKLLIECRPQIVSEIESGVKSLADALYREGFISKDELDSINELPETKTEKARRLSGAIENKVKYYPHNYRKFVAILREKSPEFDDLLETLDETMKEGHQTTAGPDYEAGSVITYASTISETPSIVEDSYIRLECPCKKCYIREFMKGADCPKSSPKRLSQLKLCKAEGATRSTVDMKYTEYKIALSTLSTNMQTKYTSLLFDTMAELKKKFSVKTVEKEVRRLLTPQGAKKSLYSRIYDRDVIGHLGDVKTYEELQEYLDKNFCSWFNIKLIADLRLVLLYHEGLDAAISAYEDHFTKYVTRCCYKFVVIDQSQSRFFEVVCQVHTDFRKIAEKQVKRFQYELQQRFDLPDCHRGVDTTSGDLTFTMKDPVSTKTTRNMTVEYRKPIYMETTESNHHLYEEVGEYFTADTNRMYEPIRTEIATPYSPLQWTHGNIDLSPTLESKSVSA